LVRCIGERALDRGQARLDLPAVEIRAVVGDCEFDVAHAAQRIIARRATTRLEVLNLRTSGEPASRMRYCYGCTREKREPGRVAMPPARQSGQSSGSQVGAPVWRQARAGAFDAERAA